MWLDIGSFSVCLALGTVTFFLKNSPNSGKGATFGGLVDHAKLN